VDDEKAAGRINCAGVRSQCTASTECTSTETPSKYGDDESNRCASERWASYSVIGGRACVLLACALLRRFTSNIRVARAHTGHIRRTQTHDPIHTERRWTKDRFESSGQSSSCGDQKTTGQSPTRPRGVQRKTDKARKEKMIRIVRSYAILIVDCAVHRSTDV
jgi:hypothetical protein